MSAVSHSWANRKASSLFRTLIKAVLEGAYFFFLRLAHMADQARIDRSGTIRSLDRDADITDQYLFEQARSAWLSARLRQYPWWSRGHYRLCEASLNQGDLVLAFASAQAVLVLERPSSSLHDRAETLLARCYVRAHEFEQARTLLESKRADTLDAEGLEELAAACIGMNDFGAALDSLNRIPESALSRDAAAAKALCERRLTGTIAPFSTSPNGSNSRR